MTQSAIKEKLKGYIQNGDPKKIKAMYALVEDDIDDMILLDDGAFWKEIDKRADEVNKKLVKTYRWDEVKKNARSMKKKGKK